MVDRHDDELAERRATTRPKRQRAAGGGALPLQWAEPPDDIPVVEDAPTFLDGGELGEEADSDVAPEGPAAEDDGTPGPPGVPPGKFGGDTMDEVKLAYENYLRLARMLPLAPPSATLA